MEWKVIKLDKTIESTFESEAEPDQLILDLSGSLDSEGTPIGYFFYDSGLFDKLITSASMVSSSFNHIRVLANETHYQAFLLENS